MRFLIVGVSLLFSFIFYLFYTANLGKNIFFQNSEYVFYGKTLLWSFMYLPILFLCFAVFFFFAFKHKNIDIYWEDEIDEDLGPVQENYNNKISTYIFIILFLTWLFYFLNYNFLYLWIILTGCIFVHFWFSYLYYRWTIALESYIQWNIFSIIFWYWFSILSILYIQLNKNFLLFDIIDQFLLYIWVLLVSIFHIYIHFRYENIVSLSIWIITIIYTLYRIIFSLFAWIF